MSYGLDFGNNDFMEGIADTSLCRIESVRCRACSTIAYYGTEEQLEAHIKACHSQKEKETESNQELKSFLEAKLLWPIL